MRIGFVTAGDTTRPTGGYRYNNRVLALLRGQGHEVDELAVPDAALAAQQAAAPETGRRVFAARADVTLVDALARGVCAPWLDALRAERPVVALVHEPAVAVEHTIDPGTASLYAPLLRADRLIVPSRDGGDVLVARGVAAARIVVAVPGCDPPAVATAAPPRAGTGRAPAAERLGTRMAEAATSPRTGTVRALCAGQWIPRKSILTLVEAWRLLAPRNATLALAGEMDVDPAYARRVWAALDGLASVRVLGPLDTDALARAYAGADLFVLPSRAEGYGMVYAEALMHGLPLVACNVGPLPELAGAAGLLVPPDDAPALAVALGRLIDEPGLRATLARAAREQARALPSWEETAAAVLGALQAAIAAHGAGARARRSS